ncbi:MAG: LamG domain-containing protein [Pseudomonadales bacterium]|nr:LamG domain-containing protein [Pseudomonadales bacterium]
MTLSIKSLVFLGLVLLLAMPLYALDISNLVISNNTDGDSGDSLSPEPDFSNQGTSFFDNSNISVPNGRNEWASNTEILSSDNTSFSTRYSAGVFSEGQFAIISALYVDHLIQLDFDVAANTDEDWQLSIDIQRLGAVTIASSGNVGEVDVGALTVSWSNTVSGTAGTLDLAAIGNTVGSGSTTDIDINQQSTAILTGTGSQHVTLNLSSETDTLSGKIFSSGKEVALRLGIEEGLSSYSIGQYPGEGSRDINSDGIFIAVTLATPPTVCALFADGAQNSSDAGSINFGSGSKITGSPDNILDTTSFIDGAGSGISCDGTSCTASGSSVNTAAAGTAAGGTDIVIGYAGSQSISPGDYGKLQLSSEATVTLSPGDYTFTEKIEIGYNANLVISGTGTVRIFVDGPAAFNGSSDINDPGTADQLFVYATGDITVYADTDVFAFLYSEQGIDLNSTAEVTGAVTAAGDIILTGAAFIYYDAATTAATDFGSFCVFSTAPVLIAEYRMETTGWNGTQGEIIDSGANNLHGMTGGNTFSSISNPEPALSGDPGSCRYANFDRDDDYISIADNDLLDFTDELSITAWIRPTAAGSSSFGVIVSKAESVSSYSYSLHLFTGNIIEFAWCSDFSNGGSCTGNNSVRSPATVNFDEWIHVAISFKLGEQRLYINGVEVASDTSSNAIIANDTNLFFGAGEDPVFSAIHEFEGQIDEVNIYSTALSSDEIQAIYQARHDCPEPVALDHYEIDIGSGTASVCSPFSITITACADNATPCTNIDDYQAELLLSTSSGRGNWSVLNSGFLVPDPDNDNNGDLNFTFDALTDGIAQMALENGHADTLTITVIDNAIPSSIVSGLISFSENGLIITENDSLNNDVIAGRNHQMQVQMQQLDSSTGLCQVLPTYTGDIDLKAYITRTVNDPAGIAPKITALTLPDIAPATNNLTLSFNSGSADFIWLTSDVGQYQINLIDDSSGLIVDENNLATTVTGSSNTFTVRPFGIAITLPPATNLSGSTFTSTDKAKAGSDITLDIKAVLHEAADDIDDNGVPDGHGDGDASNNSNLSDNTAAPAFNGAEIITLQATLIKPAAGNNPALDGDTSLNTFINGALTATVQYHEVGIIEINATGDGSYLGRATNIIGDSGFIGRFTPDHFSISINNGAFNDSCGIFTYSGQPFGYLITPEITITALSSSDQITQNYTDNSVDNWQRLQNTDIDSIRGFATADGTKTQLSVIPPASPGNVGTLPQGSSGVMVYRFNSSDEFTYDNSDADAITGPFTSDYAIIINSFNDGDGAGFTATGSEEVRPTAVDIRLGRWTMENGFGPETLDLSLAGHVEFIDNNGDFIINTDDSCSNVSSIMTTTPTGPTSIAVGAGTSDFSLTNNNIINTENALLFSSPGAGNTGSINININLSSQPWLRFNWLNSGLIDHPEVTATFGRYRGNDRVIYWQEVNN